MKIVRLVFALCGINMMAQAAVISKANNTDALNVGTSWVNGVAPGVNDVAQWDFNVTSGATYTLGADISWKGMVVTTTCSNGFSFATGNALTLGASGITTVPDKGITLNNPVTLATNQTWSIGANTFIPAGGVNLNGYALSLSGGGTKQFKSLISGGGSITNQGGAVKLTNTGAAAPTTDIILNNANITFETNMGLPVGPRTKSLLLKGGSVNIGSRTAENSAETNANELVIGPGAVSTVTLTPNSYRSAMFYSGSFSREMGGVVNFRGTALGTNTIASLTSNSVNMVFGTAPALVGGSGGPHSTTNGIIVGVLADTTTTGSGMGLATYDEAYGVRLINPLTECTSVLVDGQSQLDNVRLTNAVSMVFTNTLNSATIINSLSFRIDAGAQTNCGIRINGPGPLILNSGSIAGMINATSIVITNSFFLDVATLDLNGREGVISALGTGTQSTGGGSHSGAVIDLACSITNDGGKGVTISGNVVKFSGSSTNRYTGDTRCNGGFLWLAKTTPLPGSLVVNGGKVQNTGEQIPDAADLVITGGEISQRGGEYNSGSGASETFRNLYMTGGTYNDGTSGTSSGNTTLTNATLAGGTWNVTKGHVTTLRGWLSLSGGVVNYSGSTDSTSGGRVTLNGPLTITNIASGVYTCMTINSASSSGNAARLVLTNDVTFVANSENSNTTVIAAPAGSKQGTILLSNTIVFDIGDGPASTDLLLESFIANNGAVVGGLTKMGSGSLALTSTNAYTGATAVSNGTLVVNGSVASSVTVSSGATFAGTGLVQVVSGTALSVNANGIVNPGTVAGTVGTLSATGNVTCASASVFHVDINGSNADCLVASGNVSGGSVVVDVSLTGIDKGPWVIMRANQITGTYTVHGAKLIASISPNGTELVLRKNDGTLISFQ